MKIRLEYSPVVGKFNKAKADDKPNRAKGFCTLCCFMDESRATRFIHTIEIKHPELLKENITGFPSIDTMKEELLSFIEEDIMLLQQSMETTFQRRSSLYRSHS
ncbi:MAG: hypothetical protein JST26_05755 [Bacteroidetes bacterium]|nr:hypothetical protein [Bacteroidota bacterium]